MKTKKGKSSVIVKVMYIIAAVFAAVCVYMAIVNAMYISSYAATYGISVSAMMGDAVQYVLTGSVEYLAYAVVIFGIGKIMSMIQNMQPAAADEAAEIVETEEPAAEETFGIPAEAIAAIMPSAAEKAEAPLEIANEEVEVPANEDISEVTVGSEDDAKCDIACDEEETAEAEEEAEDAETADEAEAVEEAADEEKADDAEEK